MSDAIAELMNQGLGASRKLFSIHKHLGPEKTL
jgi:hypothetical protein